jgi:hypothetical protein
MYLGGYLPFGQYMQELEAAAQVPMISMCMRAVEKLVLEKEPILSRQSGAAGGGSGAPGGGGGGALHGAAATSEAQKFQQLYRTTLRPLSIDALRMILGVGLVPVRFIRKRPLFDGAAGASATGDGTPIVSMLTTSLFSIVPPGGGGGVPSTRQSAAATGDGAAGADSVAGDALKEGPQLGDAGELYSHAVVPRLVFAVWRYYDMQQARYEYVLLRPTATSSPQHTEWEVDDDGVVLSGFGFDPLPGADAKSVSIVSTSLPTAAHDAQLEYDMMLAQDQLARPLLMLESRAPATSSSGIDADMVQSAFTRGAADYPAHSIDRKMHSDANLVDGLDRKVQRLHELREHELRNNLPLTSFLSPPAHIVAPGDGVPSSMVALPPGMSMATYTMPQTVAQFTEIRRHSQSLVAANFGIPTTFMVPTEQRSVSGNHAGEQQVVDGTVKTMREHLARVMTVVYRRLKGAKEARRFREQMTSVGEWQRFDVEKAALRTQRAAPVIEYVPTSRADFQQTLALYETGVIDEHGYRTLVADMFQLPPSVARLRGPPVLKRERDVDGVVGIAHAAVASTSRAPDAEQKDGGASSAPKKKQQK